MLFERLIIAIGENRLRPYRMQAEIVRQEMAAAYEKYLPGIEALYRRATHWHGTGRYRYARVRDLRNQAAETPISDVLLSIVESGGLQPYRDPWIDSGGSTVSLATARMLARAFARIHACQKTAFRYELGSIKFWLRLYFFLFFVWLFADKKARSTVIRGLFRGSFFRDLRLWESAIRKFDANNRSIGVLNGFRRNILVSDIEGNYPILIGIAIETGDPLIGTTPIARAVEQRSLRPVSVARFTHIEVPLQDMMETEILLSDRGISIPVIPLEFGDMYLAGRALEKLAYV